MDDKPKKMTKARSTTEKAAIRSIAVGLMALGVTVLTTASQHIAVSWQFACEATFGILMLTIGFITFKTVEYLKLNRWSHFIHIDDNPPLNRLITYLEGKK